MVMDVIGKFVWSQNSNFVVSKDIRNEVKAFWIQITKKKQ